MSELLSPENLNLKITTPLGEETFVVDQFEGTEELSDIFEYVVYAHSQEAEIDFESLLNQQVTLSLTIDDAPTYFSGIIGKIEQNKTFVDAEGRTLAHYKIYIYPQFWRTQFTKDYRIFQESTAQEIIETLLDEMEIPDYEFNLENSDRKTREYCVQYDETNFHFISRLLEEEGIYYYFIHDEFGHKLIFTDSVKISLSPANPEEIRVLSSTTTQPELNAISKVSVIEQVVPKTYMGKDFNFMTPSTAVKGEAEHEKVGVGKIKEYPAGFDDSDQGEEVSTLRSQELEWSQKTIRATSTVFRLGPNLRFALTEHTREDMNRGFVCQKIKHKITQKIPEGNTGPAPLNKNFIYLYQNEIWAFPDDINFRPPRIHGKKKIHSHQTAIVTGPQDEEIYVDELGRVKVKFHWDTYSENNEDSSCWVRVAQTWAGGGFGALVIPRVGMEVVIGFTNGDPDKPLILGCIYNGDNAPPENAENPTRSIFQTSSSKGGSGKNVMYFDDADGMEEIYTHAQQMVNTDIILCRNEIIRLMDDTLMMMAGDKEEFLLNPMGSTRHTFILNGERTVEIKMGNHSVDITMGDQTVSIDKGNREVEIKAGDSTLTIGKGNQEIQIGKGNHDFKILAGNYSVTLGKGNVSLMVNGNIDIKSTGKISMTAVKGIDFKSPKPITMTSLKTVDISGLSGVTAKSPKQIALTGMNAVKVTSLKEVALKSAMKFSIQGLMLDIKAGTNLKVNSGGMIISKAAGIAKSECGAMFQLKAGAMLKAEGGAMTQIKGGAMLKAEGGAMGMYQGGAMAALKGALMKIG
jgi:type VI secretion system secreted protein VgrG